MKAARLLSLLGVLLVVAIAALASVAGANQDVHPPSDSREHEARILELLDRGREERDRGRLDASIRTFEQARAIAEQAGDGRWVMDLDSQIMSSLDRAGRLEALLDHLHGMETRVDDLDADPELANGILVHVHADLSRTLYRLGRPNEALAEARDAVRSLDATRDPAARGSACNAMGVCLLALGQLAEARTWLQRSADLAEELHPSDPRRVEAGLILAHCLGELGDSDAALDLAESLVDRWESSGSASAFLGWKVYSLRGRLRFYEDWSAAEQDLTRARTLMEEAGIDERQVAHQQTVLELAHAIRNTGRPAVSAEMERHALSVLREHHGDSHPTTIRAAQFLGASLADLYHRTGDRKQLAEAREHLEFAARRSREIDDPQAASAYAPLGELILDDYDDPTAAEPWMQSAVDCIESGSSARLAIDESQRADLLRHRRLHKRFDPYEGLLRCLIRLDRREEAFGVLERSRGRSLADLLERSRFDPLREALEAAEGSGDRRTAERIRQLPTRIDAAIASAAKARASGDSEDSRARARQAYEQLRELQAEQAELTRQVTSIGRIASTETIRAELDEGDGLLAYFLGRKGSYACLVEPAGGRVDWYPLVGENGRPLTAADFEAQSSAWLDALSRGAGEPSRGLPTTPPTPERMRSMAVAGNRLFRDLVPEDLWRRLAGRRVVHLVPHGALNWVPFEALVVTPPTEEPATVHWIDVGPAIAYQESGSALVWAQTRRREQNARAIPPLALIVADPAYGGTAAGAAGKRKAPVVAHVQRGGLGARAGVMAGDALLSVAGHPLESVSEGERWLVEARDPDGTPLVVDRAGVELRLKLPHGEAGLELASHLPPELRRGSETMRSASLERLPGTAREAAAVRSALESGASSEVRVLVGGEATETLLTAWASSASILHIAAHQVPDPTGCSESGRLALTAPLYATAEDDGFVDLDDLLIHWRGRLEHCGLAVLSSCWSRVGRLVPDEGFFGLPLGLRFAGCPSVVSSLWPVDDASAAELMSTFYTDLEVGSSGNRLDAFQRARRDLKRTWPDPYYWAAFVWSGSPD